MQYFKVPDVLSSVLSFPCKGLNFAVESVDVVDDGGAAEHDRYGPGKNAAGCVKQDFGYLESNMAKSA